jgi:REDY-like protein HapK
MPILVSMYNLKPGVSMEAYKKYSRELDQVVTPKQPGVRSFKIYEIKSTENEKPKYQIFEIIDVESWDAWQKVLKSDAFKQVVDEWPGDPDTVHLVMGDKIDPA